MEKGVCVLLQELPGGDSEAFSHADNIIGGEDEPEFRAALREAGHVSMAVEVEGSPGQRLENFGFFLAVHMMKGQTERFVVSGFFTVNVF
jgi:hypothetical protein